MTSLRQIDANRRNALKSTGPTTSAGKDRTRRNAVRHGLSAETVITAFEDIDDYRAFESAVVADFDAPTVAERELVLRLASLMWRLRRATSIETGLLQARAERVLKDDKFSGVAQDITACLIYLNNDDGPAFERVSRYEATLWRQLRQALFTLNFLSRRQAPHARSKPAWWRPIEPSFGD